MYFDAWTMAAVADELKTTLLGGRVQAVVLPDEWSVGLEVYNQGRRWYLLASAHPQHARVHLVGEKLRRGVDKETPLLLLLRHYGRGAHLYSVTQPPFERVLHLGLTHPDGDTTLSVEVMGRHSNIILCRADGVILDSVKRVGPGMSRVRPVLPGRPYTPPPPPSKIDPTDVTELRLRELLAAKPQEPAWRRLVQGIRGVSPLLAREVVYRATGNVDTLAEEIARITPLLEAFQELLIIVWEHAWQPVVVEENEQPVCFAPYLLTHRDGGEPVDSISQAVERYYTAVLGADPYAAAREKVRAAIQQARQRVERRREALQRSLPRPEDIEALRQKGEWILAYAHAIAPKQEKLEVPLGEGEPPLVIKLDPKLSPVENAQAYFREYRKAKAAAEEVPRLLERAEGELRYLEQLDTDLTLATNRAEIDEVARLLEEAGYPSGRAQRHPVPRCRPLCLEIDGFPVLVGRNARQNEEVLHKARPDDWWLHAHGVPGGHVIVQTGGREVPEEVLQKAAQLAAYYSRARDEARVPVAHTRRRYVRKVKGPHPGLVTYRGERIVWVKPAQNPEEG